MDDRQKEAVIAYINDNVLELHGLKPAESNLLDVGGEASAADIVDARLDGADAVVLVNRGIKGIMKYRVPTAKIKPPEPPKTPSRPARSSKRKTR